MGTTRKQYFTMQAGRGIAALLVVVYHSAQILANPRYWGQAKLAPIFAGGSFGVQYFFALSGAVILLAHMRDIGKPATLTRFAIKRIGRIYPIYWIVALAVIVGFGHGIPPSTDVIFNIRNLLSNFLLIALQEPAYILSVSWTLFHEVLFYGAFSFLLLNKRFGTFVLATWFALSCVAIVALPQLYLRKYLFSPLHLIFGIGMIAAWLLKQRTVARAGLIFCTGIVLFVSSLAGAATLAEIPSSLYLVVGIAAGFIILGGARLEEQGRLRVAGPWVFLGDASYSLYLVHLPVMFAIAPWWYRHAPQAGAVPVMLGLIAIAVLAGCLTHITVERPLLRLLNRHKFSTGNSARPEFEKAQASLPD